MSAASPRPVSDLLADFLRPAFLVRLTFAYVAAAALLMLAEPVLGAVLARGARDLILLTSSIPHLDTLIWNGEHFQATTHLLGGHLSLEPQGYWFVVAFPAGFAAALPGLLSVRGLVRLLVVTACSIAFAAIFLAIESDGLLTRALHDVHLRVNPPWRDMLVRSAMGRFWDFAALMYPFAACLAVAWAAVAADPAGAGATRGLHWTTGAAVLAGAIFLLAGDRYAEQRRVGNAGELQPALEAMNPLLGRHMLLRAQKLEAQGHLEAARQSCIAAARYPHFEQKARQCEQRLTQRIRAGARP